MIRKDYTGTRFGRLVVIGLFRQENNANYWSCKCDCGVEKVINGCGLISGRIISCGCYNKEQSAIRCKDRATHNMRHTRVYKIWAGMKERCNNKANPSFHNYGGRGIKVCERWSTFKNFYEDMGDPPDINYSIDRINNDGNYEPGNCRWVTTKQQNNNTRFNIYIEINGVIKTLMEWTEEFKMPYALVYNRLAHKMPVGIALTLAPDNIKHRQRVKSIPYAASQAV